MAMTFLGETTLTSTTTFLSFTNIPQDYLDLLFLISVRGSRTDLEDQFEIRFNSSGFDYGAYEFVRFTGDTGGAQTSKNSANDVDISVDAVPANSEVTGNFGNTAMYVSGYTTSEDKAVSVDAGRGLTGFGDYVSLATGTYIKTSAITSVHIRVGGGNLLTDSEVQVYGIS